MTNPDPAISSPATSTLNVRPNLECDIVMKGGITSGVVYPLAVVELAKTYRFRNIGGTSAGAIAAATAAAELGRDQSGGGFGLLEALPNWLQEPANDKSGSRLQALFQPQPETRSLFGILLAALEPGNKVWNLALAALKAFWPSVIVGALPALLALWLLRSAVGLEVVFGVLLLFFGVVAAILYRVFQGVTREIPANRFGLCNGYRPRAEVAGPDPALTEWLHGYLNELAGRNEDDSPLTFAHLQKANINLLMMTTNLTHGLPQRLPFETKLFFYNPAEFAQLFPPAVIAHLERYNQTQGGSAVRLPNGQDLLRFPQGDDLPIVVAVRMSLSFPLLLSAMPLYAFEAKDGSRPVAKRCWFSDGGITSNFPVHFFDGPLPNRPTFAINLIPFGEGEHKSNDENQNVDMPIDNRGGIQTVWSHFDQTSSGTQQLLGFLGAIFGAAQNWADNSQLPMPGYRDRIAHVKLDASEGGLNLNMSKSVLESLSARGKVAAKRLLTQFNSPELDAATIKEKKQNGQPVITLTWLNHRWVRYRATMASLEQYLFALHETYTQAPPDGGPSYENLIARGPNDPPASYRLSVHYAKHIDQTRFALETTQELMALIAGWKAKHQNKNAASFNSGEKVPNPRATLRAQPGGQAPTKQTPDPSEDAGSIDDI